MSVDTRHLATDVLVVGAGFAGCRAAIAAHDAGAAVLMVSGGPFPATGSSFHPMRLGWGRGYTAGLGRSGPGDTPDAHLAAILAAGQGLVDLRLARVLVDEAPARFRELEGWGVRFTTMSAALALDHPDHGRGPMGALAMAPDNLRASFRRQIEGRGIDLRQRWQVLDLLGEPGRCAGALVAAEDALVVVSAAATILASGGPDDLFLYNLNTPDLTGACHVMALDLGATLVNMEFYQLILGFSRDPHASFSEALLELAPAARNGLGEPFLARYWPGDDEDEIVRGRAGTGPFSWDGPGRRFDLAVTRELIAGRGAAAGGVTLDFSRLPDLTVPQTIANRWRGWAEAQGVSFAAPIEIALFAHACNGGIYTDASGATGVAGLWACGEAAGGMHGANRIGGNQFSAAQVFGRRAGLAAAAYAAETAGTAPALPAQDAVAAAAARLHRLASAGETAAPALLLRRRLQRVMWREAMVERSAAGLARAAAEVAEVAGLAAEAAARSPGERAVGLGLPRATAIAGIILDAAARRRESRGPHYRTDYPARDDAAYGKPIFVGRDPGTGGYTCRLVDTWPDWPVPGGAK